jgi:nitrogenase iron protein NifH
MGSPYSREILDEFAAKTHTRVVEYIPRSITVTKSELQGKTTIEASPLSAQVGIYRFPGGKDCGTFGIQNPHPHGDYGIAGMGRQVGELFTRG